LKLIFEILSASLSFGEGDCSW